MKLMITVLKEMQLSLKEDKGFNNCQAIARSLLSMGYSDSIVMSRQICEDINHLSRFEQLSSICFKLKDINNFNAEYYWETGYGHYEDLTADKLDNVLYDLIQDMERG